MKLTAALYALQQIDTARDQHARELKAIADQLGDSPAIQQARADLATIDAQLTHLRRQVKRLADNTAALREKRQRSEDRLYSGTVKNPKELQDLQHEIEALARQAATLDDQQLELMISIETAEAELAAAQSHLESATANWRTNQQDLLAAQQRHQHAIVELTQQRQTALTGIPASALAAYDQIRKARHGQAVAILSTDGTCQACGVGVNTALRQQARMAETWVTCPTCGRIWHVE